MAEEMVAGRDSSNYNGDSHKSLLEKYGNKNYRGQFDDSDEPSNGQLAYRLDTNYFGDTDFFAGFFGGNSKFIIPVYTYWGQSLDASGASAYEKMPSLYTVDSSVLKKYTTRLYDKDISTYTYSEMLQSNNESFFEWQSGIKTV